MDFYPIPTCGRFCFWHIGFRSSQKFGVRPNLRVEYISSKSSAQQAQPPGIAPETRPFLKRKGSSQSPKHHFSRGFWCSFQELISAKITQIFHGISGTMRCHEWTWRIMLRFANQLWNNWFLKCVFFATLNGASITYKGWTITNKKKTSPVWAGSHIHTWFILIHHNEPCQAKNKSGWTE